MADHDDFEAQMDIETLQRAEKVLHDPGRMGRAKEFARRQSDVLKDQSEALQEFSKSKARTRRVFDGAVKR